MKELKITIDQLKNYLGTGLKLKTDFKTIGGIKVGNPYFTMDSINLHGSFNIWTYDPEFCKQFIFMGKGFRVHQIKPICYRLSDLDKEIEHNGERFVPVEKLFPIDTEFERSAGITSMDYMQYLLNDGFESFHYYLIQKIFEWHFWPFGDKYFEQGLVIDKRREAINV